MDAIVVINLVLGAGFLIVLLFVLWKIRVVTSVVSWCLFVLAATSLFVGNLVTFLRPLESVDWLGGYTVFTAGFVLMAGTGLIKMYLDMCQAGRGHGSCSASAPETIGRPGTDAEALLDALHDADPATMRHSQRVAELAVRIGREMKMSEAALEELWFSALLHDVGKMGVRSTLLTKSQRLTDEEWSEIKDHTWLGRVILNRAESTRQVGNNVLRHHEKYDGTGYPGGLQGEEIPLAARIVAVADTYDAITHGRHYQQPRDRAKAVDELLDNAGTQFDPAVVMAFLRVLRSGERKGLLALEAV